MCRGLSQDSREMTRAKGKRGKGGEKGLRKGERQAPTRMENAGLPRWCGRGDKKVRMPMGPRRRNARRRKARHGHKWKECEEKASQEEAKCK